MVFPDIANSFDLNRLTSNKSPANIVDRFFSFLIDYLVISPFVLFLLYMTFSNGFNFLRAHPTAPENTSFILIFSFCYVVYFSLIQSAFITVWSATPGQYFLKIRIKFHMYEKEAGVFNKYQIFFKSFLRQFLFWTSFLLLGLPFLSMMTNKARRTFYDRVVEVSVTSKKNEPTFFNFEKEYRYWQSFTVTLVLFAVFFTIVLVWKNYTKIVQRSSSFAVLQDKRFFCEELEDIPPDERLQFAVALNLADQLSDVCLDKEADFAIWKQKKSDYSLAYYAKSLTTGDVDMEKKYLQQSCDGQNTQLYTSLPLGCKISYSFLNNKIAELYLGLNEENFLNHSLKYELGLILYNANKLTEIENNFVKIKKYNAFKLVKKYQVIETLSRNMQLGLQEPLVTQKAAGIRNPANSTKAIIRSKYDNNNTEIMNLIELVKEL